MDNITENETQTETPPLAKKKVVKRRKQIRRARPAAPPPAAVAKPVTEGQFAGLTVTDCCDGCDIDGCVISGKPYCAHPRKGGLHSQEIQEPAALRRMQQAKRLLGQQKLDIRGE